MSQWLFGETMIKKLKEVCEGINKCYEVRITQIGTNQDHVRFLTIVFPCQAVKKITYETLNYK